MPNKKPVKLGPPLRASEAELAALELPPSQEAVDADGKRWVQVGQAVTAGMPLDTALRTIMGWEDDDLAMMQADMQAGFITDNEQ